MTSAIVIETAALANYTWSVWESSHTLSFTAALALVVNNQSKQICKLKIRN